MKFKAVLPKVSSLFIDATIFAYISIPLNFLLLYGILTKFLGHSSGNCFLPTYYLANLSLAAIFWAVSFFAFLLPLPTVSFLIWNLYRYCFLRDAQTQHLILIVGYVLAVVTAILFRIAWRKFLHFSPGSSLCNLPHSSKKSPKATSSGLIARNIVPALVASELVEISQALLPWRIKSSNEPNSNENVAPVDNETDCKNRKIAPIFAILLSMVVGLGLSSQWKLPLLAKARELEHKLPLPTGPADVPICGASMCWLFAGDGVKAIQLAESQIKEELKTTVPTTKTRINKLMEVIDLADRSGYCDSNHWQQISQPLFKVLSEWFATTDFADEEERVDMRLLAKYLRDGDERHGFYSQADRVDSLRLAAYLKTFGQNSTRYIDSLHDSALFHLRIKYYAQASKQFTSVIDLCETNMSRFEDWQKASFIQTALDSRQKLVSLNQNSAH